MSIAKLSSNLVYWQFACTQFNASSDWFNLIQIIQFIIYLVLPTLAAIHVLIFDVKDCAIVFLYTLVISAIPRHYHLTIFGKYCYRYIGDLKSNYDTCPICWKSFDELKRNESTCEIAVCCGHIFCEKCIDQWEHHSRQSSCPLCRELYYSAWQDLKIRYKLDVNISKEYFSIYVDWKKYNMLFM
eukprot:461735_1